MIKVAIGIVIGLCISAGAFGAWMAFVGNLVEQQAVKAATSAAPAIEQKLRQRLEKPQ